MGRFCIILSAAAAGCVFADAVIADSDRGSLIEIAAAAETGPTTASQPAATQPWAPTGLHFTFTPALWLPRVSGTASLGPSSAARDIALRSDLKLDDTQPTF